MEEAAVLRTMQIRLPFNELKEKILAGGSINEQELETKIAAKLEQLSGLISKEGAAHIIANELGITLFENTGKIKDIYPGMRNINTNAKILNVYEARTFSRSDGSTGKVCSALIGDETGTIRLVGWGNKAESVAALPQGTIIGIENTYARENNRGGKELHLNDNSIVTKNPQGISIEKTATPTTQYDRKTINTLTEEDTRVELLGTVVQVFDLRFFETCPQCNTRVKQGENGWECPTHKQLANPDYGYVMNLFIDDGTERIRAVLFREQVEKITGKTKDSILTYKENPESFDDIKTELLGEQFVLQGKVKKNTFFDRLEFTPYNIKVANAEEELKKMEGQ